jgi:LysM repeat protein
MSQVVHTVVSGDSLWRIATQYSISVERLKELNGLGNANLSIGQRLIVSERAPNQVSSPNRATHHVVVAGDSLWRVATQYGVTVDNIRTWNALTTDALRLGQNLRIAPPQTQQTQVSQTTTQQTTQQAAQQTTQQATQQTTQQQATTAVRYHVVQAGDSLWRVANQHSVSVAEIRAWNNLTSDMLTLGQRLAVSPAQTTQQTSNNTAATTNTTAATTTTTTTSSQPISVPTHVVRVGDSMWRIASQYNVSVPDIRRFNNLSSDLLSIGQILYLAQPVQQTNTQTQTATQEAADVREFFYTVQAGDSLWKIATQFNVPVATIQSLNNLTSNALSVGQRLRLQKPNQSNHYEPTKATNTNTGSTTQARPITASVGSLPNADSSVPLPSAERLAQIRRNVAETVQMEVINCVPIFGNGITAAVGRNSPNHAADVEKVQRAMVQRNLLQSIGGVSQIQATIAGIETFQTRNNMDWWAGKASIMGGRGGFTKGVIAPDDATYILMRDHSTFRITYKDFQNRPQNIQFTNFLRSNFSVYAAGVSFAGTAIHDIPRSFFEGAGLSPTLSEALAFVSKNEGNYDAINSYDRAAFSFGFIQFAGQTANGTLPQFLALAKHQNPQAFEEAFGKFGIDVEFAFRNNKYEPAQVVVIRPDAPQGQQMLRGVDAEAHLRSDKVLHAIFVRAGHNIEIAKLQVLSAVQEYVNPALRSRISLNVNGIVVDREPTTDYIRSALGITVLIDMAINQGLTGALRLFQPAIEGAARQLNIRSKDALKNINERAVIQQMITNATDSRVRTRPQKALEAGISSNK